MKNILSDLHKIASVLENENLIKEAQMIDKVFIKLSDRKVIWQPSKDNPYQNETQHQYSPLKNYKGQPSDSNDISAYDTLLNTRIRNSPAYSYYQDLYIAARDAYKQQLSKFSNPQFRSNQKEEKLLKYLKAEWEASVEDFENWFIKALIQAKVQGRIPGIPKQQTAPSQSKPQPKPALSPKPMAKPQSQPSKPVIKPTVKQVIKPQPMGTINTTRKPGMEIGIIEIDNKAQAYMDQLKQKMKDENLKSWQAYALMQFQVYNEDKTSGKLVYKKWQDMIDEYDAQQKNLQNNNTPTQ